MFITLVPGATAAVSLRLYLYICRILQWSGINITARNLFVNTIFLMFDITGTKFKTLSRLHFSGL